MPLKFEQLTDTTFAGVQSMQELLVNLDFVPFHCDADGCNDLHLRFVTRSDRDSMVSLAASIVEGYEC